MAFTAGKSKEIEGKSNDWLLDQSLMQSMQDRFCDANDRSLDRDRYHG